MSLSRAHLAIDWIAVYLITRSIITITDPSDFANSARAYISSIVPAVTFRYVPLTSPVAALARFTASMQYRNRSRQCMKGWLLMFSSSFVKSRPPFSAS